MKGGNEAGSGDEDEVRVGWIMEVGSKKGMELQGEVKSGERDAIAGGNGVVDGPKLRLGLELGWS